MRCKKLFIFVILSNIILINFFCVSVFAACAGGDSQLIMRLYQIANSHGAVYNDAHGYNTEICYDEIFLSSYAGSNAGPNVQLCTGNNQVLALKYNYNSHAKVSSGGGYDTPICFGDLVCTIKPSLADCTSWDANAKIILSLFSETNSHIAKGDFAGYNYKICCKTGGGTLPTTISELYFANMTEQKIREADLNDRVKLTVSGQNFLGKEIKYQIWKDNPWWFDKKVAQSSTREFITWRAGLKDGETIAQSGDYYFIINIDGNDYDSRNIPANNPYGTLEVRTTESNSPPVAIINFPKRASIYSLTTDISFIQSSYDLDDFMDYKWDFGDTNFITGSTRDYINYNTAHTYPNTGQKNINLSVLDERGKSDYDLTSILIIDLNIPPGTSQAYVYANISNPEIGENVANPVLMDAVGSYAINITSNPAPADPTITCLAGACPAEVITPSGIITIIDPNGKRGNYLDLTFKWKFDNGAEGEVTKHGDKQYTKSFGSLGWHNAELTVNITPTVKSSVNTRFRVYGEIPACLSPPCNQCLNGIWLVFDPNNPLSPPDEYITTEPNSKCKGANGIAGDGDDCCPQGGFICRETGHPGTFNCQLDSGAVLFCDGIRTCEDYTLPNDCTLDSCNKGNQNAECGRFVFDVCPGFPSSTGVRPNDKCKCEWVPTDPLIPAVGTCKQKGNFDISIEGINIQDISCSVTSTARECLDDSMQVDDTGTINWPAIDPNFCARVGGAAAGCVVGLEKDWLSDPTHCDLNSLCFTGTRSVICGEDTVKLKFFTWLNLIIAIIIITIIYASWFAIKKRKKSLKRNKKKK